MVHRVVRKQQGRTGAASKSDVRRDSGKMFAVFNPGFPFFHLKLGSPHADPSRTPQTIPLQALLFQVLLQQSAKDTHPQSPCWWVGIRGILQKLLSWLPHGLQRNFKSPQMSMIYFWGGCMFSFKENAKLNFVHKTKVIINALFGWCYQELRICCFSFKRNFWIALTWSWNYIKKELLHPLMLTTNWDKT